MAKPKVFTTIDDINSRTINEKIFSTNIILNQSDIPIINGSTSANYELKVDNNGIYIQEVE